MVSCSFPLVALLAHRDESKIEDKGLLSMNSLALPCALNKTSLGLGIRLEDVFPRTGLPGLVWRELPVHLRIRLPGCLAGLNGTAQDKEVWSLPVLLFWFLRD